LQNDTPAPTENTLMNPTPPFGSDEHRRAILRRLQRNQMFRWQIERDERDALRLYPQRPAA